MKKILLILLFFCSLLSAEEASAKVVYDLTTKNLATFELKILKSIVANKTYYEGKLKELDVSVVIHGGAYRFFAIEPNKNKLFKKDKALIETYKTLAKRIKTMSDTYDVEFLICEVGMKKKGLSKKDIYSFVSIIPNATIGLIDRQNEGYAYIPIKE
jgi:intracellular sulfur oxidation DsrE/DsrF family protein